MVKLEFRVKREYAPPSTYVYAFGWTIWLMTAARWRFVWHKRPGLFYAWIGPLSIDAWLTDPKPPVKKPDPSPYGSPHVPD